MSWIKTSEVIDWITGDNAAFGAGLILGTITFLPSPETLQYVSIILAIILTSFKIRSEVIKARKKKKDKEQ